MNSNTLTTPLSGTLLKSRFDNAHLVRVDEETHLIAVWNGSQTINLYNFTLNELENGVHTVPKQDGDPAPREEVNDTIDELFDEYRSER